MLTPWGELGTLDLDDHELCRTILASDKHRLIEGLVVESVFDQIFDDVPAHLEGAVLLDVDTAIVDTGHEDDRWQAFVWARTREQGLGRYLTALGKGFRVWLVETDVPVTGFSAREWKDGKLAGHWLPLADVTGAISGRRPRQVDVAHDARDAKRQQQSFWGFLSGQHGSALGQRVILPRIFMNCGIQPWFRAVWNLDRILVRGDDIWLLEIKHKFPMRGTPLSFGLNEGELGVIVRLGEAGIRCLHTIVIKPVWSTETGAMYLFNDMRMRARAALVSIEMDRNVTTAMLGSRRGSSAGHTTFSGSGNLSFYPLKASAFSRLGVLSDPAHSLAASLARAVSGSPLPRVEDQWLLALKAAPDAPAAGN